MEKNRFNYLNDLVIKAGGMDIPLDIAFGGNFFAIIDADKIGFEINQSDQIIAIYNETKIVVMSAKSGLLITDMYSPPNISDENKIDNVEFDTSGNLQIAVGSKLFTRKLTSPSEIKNLSPKVLNHYTGISNTDGLTYLRRLGIKH